MRRRESQRHLALGTLLSLRTFCERTAVGSLLAGAAVLYFAAHDPFANVALTYGLVLLLALVAGGLFCTCRALARQALQNFGHDVHSPTS